MDGFDRSASIMKALSHPARLQILEVLRREEACVCHLENALNMRQAYISQQLARLREAGLVIDRRDGMNVFYALADPGIEQLLDAAYQAATGLAQADRKQLQFTPLEAGRRQPCPCPKCAVDYNRLTMESATNVNH